MGKAMLAISPGQSIPKARHKVEEFYIMTLAMSTSVLSVMVHCKKALCMMLQELQKVQ
jgi:hypothetical protein